MNTMLVTPLELPRYWNDLDAVLETAYIVWFDLVPVAVGQGK